MDNYVGLRCYALNVAEDCKIQKHGLSRGIRKQLKSNMVEKPYLWACKTYEA